MILSSFVFFVDKNSFYRERREIREKDPVTCKQDRISLLRSKILSLFSESSVLSVVNNSSDQAKAGAPRRALRWQRVICSNVKRVHLTNLKIQRPAAVLECLANVAAPGHSLTAGSRGRGSIRSIHDPSAILRPVS